MDFWYTENHTKNSRFSIRINKQLYSKKSKFQRIDVFDTPEFGRILTLDGIVMLTEKDEFIYHEMITHVPMAVHPNVKEVLVIGAGDGGTIRELTQYQSIEHIDMVEIDEQVVLVCEKYLPQTSCNLHDPRVNLLFCDGLKFVRDKKDCYDLIIVDSTDPFGPGEGLFSKEFYGSCYKALREDGILINQHESPYYSEDAAAVRRIHKKTTDIFPINEIYQFHLPTYPSGHWLFGFISKKYDPVKDLQAKTWNALHLKTRYYNTPLHVGAFALPTYVNKIIKKKILED